MQRCFGRTVKRAQGLNRHRWNSCRYVEGKDRMDGRRRRAVGDTGDGEAVSQREWPADLLEWGNPVSHQRFGDSPRPIREHLRLAAKGS